MRRAVIDASIPVYRDPPCFKATPVPSDVMVALRNPLAAEQTSRVRSSLSGLFLIWKPGRDGHINVKSYNPSSYVLLDCRVSSNLATASSSEDVRSRIIMLLAAFLESRTVLDETISKVSSKLSKTNC